MYLTYTNNQISKWAPEARIKVGQHDRYRLEISTNRKGKGSDRCGRETDITFIGFRCAIEFSSSFGSLFYWAIV